MSEGIILTSQQASKIRIAYTLRVIFMAFRENPNYMPITTRPDHLWEPFGCVVAVL
jgi:hypothetical protein